MSVPEVKVQIIYHLGQIDIKIQGAFFWGYSGYSYSGLGITEYTEFPFRKERSYMFQIWKRNRR